MKLTVFGKYGPYPKKYCCTSGYMLTEGKCNIAFEMGAGVFSRLSAAVRPEDLSALIISHYHFDHIADLGVLNYYLESLDRAGQLKCKLRLIAPNFQCEALNLIKEMKYFELDLVCAGDERIVGGITFKFFQVQHPVYTLGFKTLDKTVFLYSADTDVCDAVIDNLKDSNVALLDGAFLSSQYRAGGPHMSAEICSSITKEKGVKTFISHFLPKNNELEIISETDSHCVIVQEGEVYEL